MADPLSFEQLLGAAARGTVHQQLASLPPFPDACRSCLICGPESSGLLTLALQYATSVARPDRQVLLICQRQTMEVGVSELPFAVADEAQLQNVQLRYLTSLQQLQRLAACLHLLPVPHAAIVVHCPSSFPSAAAPGGGGGGGGGRGQGERRGREADLAKALAYLVEAAASARGSAGAQAAAGAGAGAGAEAEAGAAGVAGGGAAMTEQPLLLVTEAMSLDTSAAFAMGAGASPAPAAGGGRRYVPASTTPLGKGGVTPGRQQPWEQQQQAPHRGLYFFHRLFGLVLTIHSAGLSPQGGATSAVQRRGPTTSSAEHSFSLSVLPSCSDAYRLPQQLLTARVAFHTTMGASPAALQVIQVFS